MRFSFLIGICLVLFFACQTDDGKEALVPLNLLEYEIPLTILAPDSAKIKKQEWLYMKDVTVQKGEDFYVQIYASEASTTDITRLLAEQLKSAKEDRYFSKIIREEPAGFIYETMVDSNHISYNFRHVRVQGDNEYIFQTGLIGTFTLEDVEIMYKAVQPQ